MKAKWITLTLAAILAATVTAVSLTACGSSDTASVAESATSETASAATSDITSTTTANSETDTESAEETTAQAATEQPVAQPEKPVQTTNTGATAQQPQTTAPATPAPQNHAPLYRQQWVVDQAAWTEELPVCTSKEVAVCNHGCGVIDGNIEQHMLDKLHGWHSEVIQVQTGTRIIQHEEQGHYEQVLVCAGCTGTH